MIILDHPIAHVQHISTTRGEASSRVAPVIYPPAEIAPQIPSCVRIAIDFGGGIILYCPEPVTPDPMTLFATPLRRGGVAMTIPSDNKRLSFLS